MSTTVRALSLSLSRSIKDSKKSEPKKLNSIFAAIFCLASSSFAVVVYVKFDASLVLIVDRALGLFRKAVSPVLASYVIWWEDEELNQSVDHGRSSFSLAALLLIVVYMWKWRDASFFWSLIFASFFWILCFERNTVFIKTQKKMLFEVFEIKILFNNLYVTDLFCESCCKSKPFMIWLSWKIHNCFLVLFW